MNHAHSAGPTSSPSPEVRDLDPAPEDAAALEGSGPPAVAVEGDEGPHDSAGRRADALMTQTDPIAVSQIREALRDLGRSRVQPHVLIVIHHKHGAETVRLTEGAGVVVGRDPASDVVIPERSLSRRHARFTFARGDVLVEDLGSTNGTFLGGQRVERGVMKPGEDVMLGEITASLRVLASAELPVLDVEALDALRGAVDWAKRAGGDDRPGSATPASGTRSAAEEGLVMRSAAMRPILETAMRLARSTTPVLLQGETGTGKDALARLIHEAGPRHKKPMICVSCSGVPAELIEGTLFGHATANPSGGAQRGVFESAGGGTVLLDEIGDLPLPLQAALLRVLETRRVVRLGSTEEIEVDVRILATTHRELEAMCEAGTFRSDLLYRLNTVPLRIPPLCERREDIGPLAGRFLQHANEAHHRGVSAIAPDALSLLEEYPWPGNVRELRNAIERAVLLAQGEAITPLDLPERVRTSQPRRHSSTPPPVNSQAHPHHKSSAEQATPASAPIGLKAQMDRLEAEIILDALRATNGNLAMAARRLRMPLRTLQEKITVHGLKRSDYRDVPTPARPK